MNNHSCEIIRLYNKLQLSYKKKKCFVYQEKHLHFTRLFDVACGRWRFVFWGGGGGCASEEGVSQSRGGNLEYH